MLIRGTRATYAPDDGGSSTADTTTTTGSTTADTTVTGSTTADTTTTTVIKPATIFEAAKTPAELEAARVAQAAALTGKLVMQERPAWLPEKFFDAKTGEVKVQDLAANEAHLRGLVSKGDHKPPADATAYKLEFTPEQASIKTAYDQMVADKDPLLASMQEAAFKAGVSNGQFADLTKAYLAGALESMPPAIDPQKELAALGKNGPAFVRYTEGLANDLVKHGLFTDADREEFLADVCTAAAMQRFHKVLDYMGRAPIEAIAAQHAVGTASAASAREKQNALIAKQAKGEHVSQAEWDAVQAEYEKAFGTAPAGRSVAQAG